MRGHMNRERHQNTVVGEPELGENIANILRRQCKEGDAKFRAALMAAGYLASEPDPVVPELDYLDRIESLELQLEAYETTPFHKYGRPVEILRTVARFYGVKVSDLKSPRRDRKLIIPRHHSMFRMTVDCPHLSYPAIGKFLGDRDHTTVLYAVKEWPDKADKFGIMPFAWPPRRVAA
jgi:antitoxin component HigA of HigAB toxin-antitoxin module